MSCSIGVDCHVIATFKFSVENLSLSKVKPNRTGRSDSLKVRTAEATATERTKQRTTESSPVGRSKKRSPSSTYMTTRSERLECSCSSSRSRRKRRDLDCRAASSVSLTCCPERKKERKKEEEECGFCGKKSNAWYTCWIGPVAETTRHRVEPAAGGLRRRVVDVAEDHQFGEANTQLGQQCLNSGQELPKHQTNTKKTEFDSLQHNAVKEWRQLSLYYFNAAT